MANLVPLMSNFFCDVASIRLIVYPLRLAGMKSDSTRHELICGITHPLYCCRHHITDLRYSSSSESRPGKFPTCSQNACRKWRCMPVVPGAVCANAGTFRTSSRTVIASPQSCINNRGEKVRKKSLSEPFISLLSSLQIMNCCVTLDGR